MRLSREPLAVVTPGLMEYRTAWDLQRAAAEARVAGTGPDTLIVLEHPPVYTAGRRTAPADRPVNGTPVIDVDRGGSITYHGPGQLVAYPIVRLAEAMFVVAYVRMLEQAVMATCNDLGLRPGPGPRPQRRLVPRRRRSTRAQGRRPRSAGRQGRHQSRPLAQLQPRPRRVRADRAVRDRRRGGDVAECGARSGRDGRRGRTAAGDPTRPGARRRAPGGPHTPRPPSGASTTPPPDADGFRWALAPALRGRWASCVGDGLSGRAAWETGWVQCRTQVLRPATIQSGTAADLVAVFRPS